MTMGKGVTNRAQFARVRGFSLHVTVSDQDTTPGDLLIFDKARSPKRSKPMLQTLVSGPLLIGRKIRPISSTLVGGLGAAVRDRWDISGPVIDQKRFDSVKRHGEAEYFIDGMSEHGHSDHHAVFIVNGAS